MRGAGEDVVERWTVERAKGGERASFTAFDRSLFYTVKVLQEVVVTYAQDVAWRK